MGAAATKQLQPDKTKHATVVLEAVKLYEEKHPDEIDRVDTFQLPVFKRHVLLAAAYSKKMGKNVDNSIAQLSDSDLEMLWGYIEKDREERKKADAMMVEEFVDEEVNQNDNIDETTSVLSYGDDEVGGDGESDIELESSGSKAVHVLAQKTDLEDLEDTQDDLDHPLKIFPSDAAVNIRSTPRSGNQQSNRTGSTKQQNEIGIAEALAKFWEIDEMGSLASQMSLEKDGAFSPLKSPKKMTKRLERKDSYGDYKDRGRRIDEQNETLLGLQRQKVISFTQNAQLEREVEALQRQLERIEQLEKTMTNSPSNKVLTNRSLGSSSSTVAESITKKRLDSSNVSVDNNYAKFPYIYPIDEEATEWNGLQNRNNGKPVKHSSLDEQDFDLNRFKKRPGGRHSTKRIISSSSEDEQQLPSRFVESRLTRDSYDNTENSDVNRSIPPNQLPSNKPLDSQLSQIKSGKPLHNNNPIRRRRRLGYGSGMDSDDSSSNIPPQSELVIHGHNKLGNRSGNSSVVGPSSDSENKPSNSPRTTKQSPTIRAEARRIRKTMDDHRALNVAAVPVGGGGGGGGLVSEDEQTAEGKSDVTTERNQRLKRLNRRRLTHDGTPQRAHSEIQLNPTDAPVPAFDRENALADSDNNTHRHNKNIHKKDAYEPDESDVEYKPTGYSEEKRKKPIRRRKKREVGSSSTSNDVNKNEVDDGEKEDSNQPWTSDLDNRWAEVSLLLRKAIKTEEDMLYCVASTEAGIIFTDQMNSIAKSLNVLRGALSRWLLPYDNNTRIETQCSTPHSVVENMPDEFRGKLTERQVHYLVAGANGVRRLVRIKIADDNDLEQARQALQTINLFFKVLYEQAKKHHLTPYQLLKQCESF